MTTRLPPAPLRLAAPRMPPSVRRTRTAPASRHASCTQARSSSRWRRDTLRHDHHPRRPSACTELVLVPVLVLVLVLVLVPVIVPALVLLLLLLAAQALVVQMVVSMLQRQGRHHNSANVLPACRP